MSRQNRPRYNPLPHLLSACAQTLRVKGRKAVSQYKNFRQDAGIWLKELYISLRRTAHHCHEALAGRRYAAPVSFLAVSGALGLVLTVTTLYTVSYAVYVDGENVGAVADQSTVIAAVASVEAMGSRMLGYEYTVDNDISYRYALTLRSDLSQEEVFEDYFSTKMDAVEEDDARLYQITVDGQPMGVIESKAEFNNLLRELKTVYTTGTTVSAEFVEEIQVTPVLLADEVLTIDQMRTILTENTTGETTYTVVSGDTFNAIAYRNDMSMSDLKALNPDVNVNKLSVGQVLNVKELIPRLSIRTVEAATYFEPIPCPVETRDDPNIYKGSSKIITQGVEGEALVTANITRVNGVEKGREVLSSETMREPTTTIKAVGTKPRPKTASNGYYKWPCRGKITSYFGYRRIFGSQSYHSGIDIAGSYGAPIAAADGGKVTFSGYKGNYGYLVIITHDNGTQTYYGHCSSLLVSAGQRVYQGQTIARVGSTGRSTGNHCHFEVRIRGSAVNPLNYLP
ncbi:MAG: LysM peptidoglycan-binding domain-containing protein [Ruminococcaceae bacterium]|nr:LysM peptidoglycan-binding domain-containing protein [Oscillospiraceae bacterium]